MLLKTKIVKKFLHGKEYSYIEVSAKDNINMNLLLCSIIYSGVQTAPYLFQKDEKKEISKKSKKCIIM